MKLREMTIADIPAGMRLKDLAGWNQTPEDWQRFLQSNPKGCFVAESEGAVCGTVTTIIYEERLAWIGMVLVDPKNRGQGIGTQLLERAIEHLDARHISTIKLDATPQGKPIYERLGFVAEFEIERWTLARQALTMPTEHQLGKPELQGILELDRIVFGADRKHLLASLHQSAPEFTLSVSRGNNIAAYSFGRRGARADHLGPWMAEDESGAREILDEFLRRSQRDTIFVDCLKSNPFAGGLLRAVRCQVARPLTRMERGSNAHPGRPDLLCAILGPEFG
ncbi:MAG TPA: GNAT family N-acetyltransferase [Terriglobia bacterium]|nr:GNAT family N-acetyltransferase [Terriglobia bacterium]